MRNPPMTGQQEQELTVREALLPVKLQGWRAKLRMKAKQEKRYRFYSLYGLVSHPDCGRHGRKSVSTEAAREWMG